ncbi:MAG: hypothetical protein KAG53_08830 [Endozoicomonadaceae bacterium]|nr:hypothetical protein [Endozoicomonadaceae bacterium]
MIKNSMLGTLLIVGILLTVVAGVLYIPKVIYSGDEASAVSRHDCMERDSACRSLIKNVGEVSLLIEPASLPAMKPLTLTVNVPAKEVTSVMVQFVGRDMAMGLQPVALAPDPFTPQVWRGEGVISLCTIDPDMVWMARLIAVVSNQTVISEFVLGVAMHK